MIGIECFMTKNDHIGILHNNKNDFQTCSQVRISSIDIEDHTQKLPLII